MTDGTAAQAALPDLTDSARTRLRDLVDLLEKWNRAINLVAPNSMGQVWTRHVADSAQLFAYRPDNARSWLDLGSGAGFPGLVIAAMAKEAAPGLQVELVESDRRKCSFLATAARTLDLQVTITPSRIESLPARRADVISARALAGLDQLCRYALPHLAPKGVCLFLKGGQTDQELLAALRNFRFEHQLLPSQTDPNGHIIRITDLAHV